MASMDNADRALNAIRKKYATTADVAKRLGFSADWEDLENGGGWDMRSSPSRDQGGPTPFPGMPRPGQGPSDQLSYGASESYDDRDAEAVGEEIAYLVRGGPEAWSELRKDEPAAYDAMVRWARDRKLRAASDRRLRGAHDRALESARQGGRSWDVAALTASRSRSHRGASDQLPRDLSFESMFPSARRIGHSGF